MIEFYTGEALFQTHENLEHLAMMEKVFGQMPDELARKVKDECVNLSIAGKGIGMAR